VWRHVPPRRGFEVSHLDARCSGGVRGYNLDGQGCLGCAVAAGTMS
jgi:hypothetical protein